MEENLFCWLEKEKAFHWKLYLKENFSIWFWDIWFEVNSESISEFQTLWTLKVQLKGDSSHWSYWRISSRILTDKPLSKRMEVLTRPGQNYSHIKYKWDGAFFQSFCNYLKFERGNEMWKLLICIKQGLKQAKFNPTYLPSIVFQILLFTGLQINPRNQFMRIRT